MAAKHSKGRSKAVTRKQDETRISGTQTPITAITAEQQRKLAHYDAIMELFAERERLVEADKKRFAEARKAAAADKELPKAVSPECMEQIDALLSKVVYSSVAIEQLAVNAIHDADISSQQWLLVSIQDSAKLNARRVDIVNSLLAGAQQLEHGNFSEEFDVPTPRPSVKAGVRHA